MEWRSRPDAAREQGLSIEVAERERNLPAYVGNYAQERIIFAAEIIITRKKNPEYQTVPTTTASRNTTAAEAMTADAPEYLIVIRPSTSFSSGLLSTTYALKIS